MTPELYALGLRARDSKHGQWHWGMGANAPGSRDIVRVIAIEDDPRLPKLPCMWETDGYLRGDHNDWTWPDHLVPDLSDPATVGCLVARLRELAAGDCVFRDGNGWVDIDMPWGSYTEGTFAEALVAALEDAP